MAACGACSGAPAARRWRHLQHALPLCMRQLRGGAAVMRVPPSRAVVGALHKELQAVGQQREGNGAAAAAAGWCSWQLARCGRSHGVTSNLTGTVRRRQGAGGTRTGGLRRPAPRQGPADGPMQHGRQAKGPNSALIGAQGEGRVLAGCQRGDPAAKPACSPPAAAVPVAGTMQLTQRQCFTPAALGQRTRWLLTGFPRPAALPEGRPSLHKHVASPPCTLLQLPPLPPPAACRRRFALQARLPSQPGHLPPAT